MTLFLVNAQKEPAINKDEAWLFQPELTVQAPDGAPIFIKRQLPSNLNNQEDEDQAVAMIYRRTVEFAVGHGTAVHAELSTDWKRATRIRTVIMPDYEVERMEPPTSEAISQLGETVLDMKQLAEMEMGEFGGGVTAVDRCLR